MVLAISPTYSQQSPSPEGFGLYEAANINNILFGRWLKQQEESLPKKAFRELLKGYGLLRREATKFIRAATATDGYEASDLAKLGTMVFSLAAPKYEALWEEMRLCGELTQDFVDALKKQMFPTKKRGLNEPVSVWKQPPGGGTRYCQIPPIHDQDTGVKLERIVLESGITPQKVVTEALECYQALKDGRLRWIEDGREAIAPGTDLAAETVRAADTDLAVGTEKAGGTDLAGGTEKAIAPGTDLAACDDLAASDDLASGTENAIRSALSQRLIAPGTDLAALDQAYAPVEETSPDQLSAQVATSSFEVAQLNKIELLYEQTSVVAPVGVGLHSSDVESQESVVQVEAQSDQAVEPEEQSKSTLMLETTGTVSADSETSCALKTDSEQHNAPLLLFPTPTPTDRWREGWKKGDVVVTNSAVPILPRWVKGEPSGFASSTGRKPTPPTGSPLQIVDVTGPVGSVQRVTLINSNFQQYSTYGNWIEEAPLCQVSGGDREWSGKVVKIDSIGRTYHRVSAVDDESCWTSIKHEFLVPIDTTEATAGVDNQVAVNKGGDSDVEQIVFSEWGFGLGDIVQWADIERSLMMAGRIYDVTADYALVDCGLVEPVPIAYPQLKKITPDNVEKGLSDHASPISQIFYKAKNYVAMWNVNALLAHGSLKELLAMCWHYKVWIDTLAMESENVLVFVPGGRDYLSNVAELVVEDDQEIPINPVEELARIFRTAIKWSQVREALLTYGYEHKNAAWNLLFDTEKKWFLSLMPEPIQKLSRLKKQGLIVDFREDASGENFFIRLQSQTGEEQHVSLVQLDEFVRSLEQF